MGHFDPAVHTGYLLRRAQQAHTQLWAVLSPDVTPVQYGVLALVHDDPGVDQKTIAERLGLDRSTITEVVARLLQRGYIDRAQATDDRRRKTLHLTAAGEDVVATIEPIAHDVDALFTRALSPADRSVFDGLLHRLAAAQESPVVDASAV